MCLSLTSVLTPTVVPDAPRLSRPSLDPWHSAGPLDVGPGHNRLRLAHTVDVERGVSHPHQ